MLAAAINIKPVVLFIIGLIFLVGLGIAGLFVAAGVLAFVSRIVMAPFIVFMNMRHGEPVDEFDEGVVFYGGIALVIGLVVAAFRLHIISWG